MGDLSNPIDYASDSSIPMVGNADTAPPVSIGPPSFDAPVATDPPAFEELLDQQHACTDSLRRSLIRSITEFEKSFRNNFRVLWFCTLTGPLLATLGILTGMGLIWDWALPGKFVYHAFLTFFVFGRFIILGGYEGQAAGWMESVSLSPGQLFGLVTYMDFMVAVFVTFHMGILFRLPWAGPKIAGLVSDGKFLMDHHSWLKRLAFVGLVTFVIFPTSTTGSIGGSIFGRLLGLGRFFTVAGVLLGSIIGNGLMYFFAKEINKYIGPDSLWLKLSGVVLLVIGVLLVEWRYRQIKNRYLQSEDM